MILQRLSRSQILQAIFVHKIQSFRAIHINYQLALSHLRSEYSTYLPHSSQYHVYTFQKLRQIVTPNKHLIAWGTTNSLVECLKMFVYSVSGSPFSCQEITNEYTNSQSNAIFLKKNLITFILSTLTYY